jgi:hypothetical protein
MTLKMLFSLAFLTTAICCFGQSTSQYKRAAFKLTVSVDEENYYSEDIGVSAYVLPDNTVQMYPSETVFIEVEQTNGVIKSIKAVKSIKDSTKTISLNFKQTTKGKIHDSMMLTVHNPFPYELEYQAGIFLMKQKKWVKTSILPIGAGLTNFETWPDVITSIALRQWKFKK